MKDNEKGSSLDAIESLIAECISTHNEAVIVKLVYRLEQDYIELAQLATFDQYNKGWTHQDVLNYVTYNT